MIRADFVSAAQILGAYVHFVAANTVSLTLPKVWEQVTPGPESVLGEPGFAVVRVDSAFREEASLVLRMLELNFAPVDEGFHINLSDVIHFDPERPRRRVDCIFDLACNALVNGWDPFPAGIRPNRSAEGYLWFSSKTGLSGKYLQDTTEIRDFCKVTRVPSGRVRMIGASRGQPDGRIWSVKPEEVFRAYDYERAAKDSAFDYLGLRLLWTDRLREDVASAFNQSVP